MSDLASTRPGWETLLADAEAFRPLLDEQWPAVSIYCPVDPAQRDIRAPQARLRRLLDEADRMLRALDVAEATRDAVLAQGRSVYEATDFAAHRDPCLVLLISPERAEVFPVPLATEEAVQVARHFHLKPLLPLLTRYQRFHVLALSAGNAKLFTATPFSWEERPLDYLPMDAEAELDSLPAGAFAPGGGQSLDDARKALLLEDMGRVAGAVRAALGTDPAPLVLAAEPNTAGHFPPMAHLSQMLEEKLLTNPFALPPSELHQRVLAVVEPLLGQEVEAVIEHANARLGTAEPTVSLRVEEILMAASEGRVEAVVVAADQTLWGRYEPGRTVEAHGHEMPGDEDLLNQAVVTTLRNGGRAFSVAAGRLPRNAAAVANFYY